MGLTAHALITTEGLQARLKRATAAEDDVERRLVDAVNASTAYLERATARRLRARNYRTSYTVSCLAGTLSTSLLATTTASMEVGDDVVGTSIAPGSQVASIASSSALELNRKVTGLFGYTSLTFGSRPMTVDGLGSSEIYAREYPLVDLFAAYYRYPDGTRVALDITDAQFDYDTGRIVLLNDSFAAGLLNIDLECRAGYVEPTATDLGHPDWFELEALAYRVAEIFYTDGINLRGRTDSTSVGNLSSSKGDVSMPSDVLAGIHRFRRMWS